MSGGERRLPDLIVIGAQKCGTSSLHRYLDLHPEISMTEKKETDFFVFHWERGLDWYRAHFRGTGRICGESSPSYTVHPWTTGIAARIHSVVPESKLIYMVRDPVERLIAQYVHNYSRCIESRHWSEIFTLDGFERSDYVCRGLYHLQLEQYLEHFSQSQILVIDQGDLRRDREATLREAFSFLGVDDSVALGAGAIEANQSAHRRRPRAAMTHTQWTRDLPARVAALPKPAGGILARAVSRRIERPDPDPALRQRLADMFRDDVDRLRDLTGKELADWCV